MHDPHNPAEAASAEGAFVWALLTSIIVGVGVCHTRVSMVCSAQAASSTGRRASAKEHHTSSHGVGCVEVCLYGCCLSVLGYVALLCTNY